MQPPKKIRRVDAKSASTPVQSAFLSLPVDVSQHVLSYASVSENLGRRATAKPLYQMVNQYYSEQNASNIITGISTFADCQLALRNSHFSAFLRRALAAKPDAATQAQISMLVQQLKQNGLLRIIPMLSLAKSNPQFAALSLQYFPDIYGRYNAETLSHLQDHAHPRYIQDTLLYHKGDAFLHIAQAHPGNPALLKQIQDNFQDRLMPKSAAQLQMMIAHPRPVMPRLR